METLRELSKKHNTDKGTTGHDYITIYEFLFGQYREKASRVLEIGIGKGPSLRMWDEYFVNAHIYGIDTGKACFKYPRGPNTSYHLVDQSNSKQLKEWSKEQGKFDIIIDDGSHIWNHQIISFEALWPRVKDGGIYVIEDVLTSYAEYWPNYVGGKISTVEYFKKLVDELNYYGKEPWSARLEVIDTQNITEYQKTVLWLMFKSNMIILKREGGNDASIPA